MSFVKRESPFLEFSLLSLVQPSLHQSRGKQRAGGLGVSADSAHRHHRPRWRPRRRGSEEDGEVEVGTRILLHRLLLLYRCSLVCRRRARRDAEGPRRLALPPPPPARAELAASRRRSRPRARSARASSTREPARQGSRRPLLWLQEG
jgi:hypothetical protein